MGYSNKRFVCSECGQVFSNRRLLRDHKINDHYDTENLQEIPWGENNPAPFDYSSDISDLFALACWYSNIYDILEPHDLSDPVVSTYNFPLAEGAILDDILEEHLKYIYTNKQRAFYFNFAPGLILMSSKSDDDGKLLSFDKQEYRYYHPSSNSWFLKENVRVSNEAELQSAINTLKSMNWNEMIKRKDTKYQVKFVSQIKFWVFDLDKPLGGENLDKHQSLLPDYILKNRYICTVLDKGKYASKNKSMCMFTALSQALKHKKNKSTKHLEHVQKETSKHYQTFVEYCLQNKLKPKSYFSEENFKGVPRDLIPHFEKCFNVSLNIYSLSPDNNASLLYTSLKQNDLTVKICLNQYDNHVNYILNLDFYAHYFSCVACLRLFRKQYLAERHLRNCTKKSKLVFTGGFRKQKLNIFDKLSFVQIHVGEQDRFNDKIVVWDIESLLPRLHSNNVSKSGNLVFISKHKPFAISVSSNVEPFKGKTEVFMEEDTDLLTSKFFQHVEKIRSSYVDFCKTKWGWVIDSLNDKMKSRYESLIDLCDHDFRDRDLHRQDLENLCKKDVYLNHLKSLKREMLIFMQQIPIIGFNSGSYDQNTVKGEFAYLFLTQYLKDQNNVHRVDDGDDLSLNLETLERNEDDIECFDHSDYLNDILDIPSLHGIGETSVLKRGNRYITVFNNYYRFLDQIQFLAPHISYDKFIKAFNPGSKKFYPFCYEHLQRFSQLSDETELPPYPGKAWRSSVSQQDILNAEYENYVSRGRPSSEEPPLNGQQKFDQILHHWRLLGWQNLGDFLRHYAEIDTKPLCPALESFQRIWFDQFSVNCYREAFSLPGLANLIMWKNCVANGYTFPLLHEKHSFLFHAQKCNVVAGASIMFSKHQEKDVTFLGKDSQVPTKLVVGADCNSLYSRCLSEFLPCNSYVVRHERDSFKPDVTHRLYLQFAWLKWMAETTGRKIHSAQTYGFDIKVGKYRCDGISVHVDSESGKEVTTLYEMFGCYWHGHQLPPDKCSVRARCKSWHPDRHQKVVDKLDFYSSLGYDVEYIYECELYTLMKWNPQINLYKTELYPEFYKKYPRKVSHEKILESIKNGTLFGLIMCSSIKLVDESLAKYYDQFPMLFANHTVEYEDLCDVTKDHITNAGIKYQPKRLLISGHKAQNIMLSSEYVRFLLNTNHFAVEVKFLTEYGRGPLFRDFISFCIEKRKMAATNAQLSHISDMYKLLANSSYGCLLKNKLKYVRTSYVYGTAKARACVNNKRFKSLTAIKENVYEVSMAPMKIVCDGQEPIALFVLSQAKIDVCKFVYNFLFTYFDRRLISILYTDTDSVYFSLGKEEIEQALKPDMKEKYHDNIMNRCDQNQTMFDISFHFGKKCCFYHEKIESKYLPGLFKFEFVGDMMLSSSSKTYLARFKNGSYKMSTKGVSKRQLLKEDVETIFRKAVLGGENFFSWLRGFKIIKDGVVTFSQRKRVFTAYYAKRGIHPEGDQTFTYTLPITLDPHPITHKCIQTSLKELSMDYMEDFDLNGFRCKSFRQGLLFLMACHLQENVVKSEVMKKVKCHDLCDVENRLLLKFRHVNRVDLMYKVALAKFNQSPDVRRTLRKSMGYTIVNCDKTSLFYGVLETPDCLDYMEQDSHTGQNLLGRTWVKLRASQLSHVQDHAYVAYGNEQC